MASEGNLTALTTNKVKAGSFDWDWIKSHTRKAIEPCEARAAE